MSTNTKFTDMVAVIAERVEEAFERRDDFEITVTASERLTNRVHGMQFTITTVSASFCAEDSGFVASTGEVDTHAAN